MTNQETLTTKQAQELGAQAFSRGAKATPAHDSELMSRIPAGSMGTSIPFLDAWSKGWHRENLRAPVE